MLLGLALCVLCACARSWAQGPRLSDVRVVFQVKEGDLEFAFYSDVAPQTSEHIFTLVQLGLYNTNSFFRLHRGFVAQTQAVEFGRLLPLNPQQQEHASKKVPLEVQPGVIHRAGVLSMGRYTDPNSGTSSFSVLLTNAPHLDMQYTIFGELTRGMDVIEKMLAQPTKQDGMFIMPLERATILSTYFYTLKDGTASYQSLTSGSQGGGGTENCEQELASLKERYTSQANQMEGMRKKLLP